MEWHPCWSHCGRRARVQMIPPSSLVISQGWGLIDLPLRASNEGLRRPRVARAQKIIRLHPLLLLDRREQPLPILDSHEGPGFAGFRRYLFAAFDEIAWFSALLRQRQVVVTGTPAKSCRHVLPRLFGPDLQDLSTEEHHIVHMV